MAIIPQGALFKWEDMENLGDLKRLQLVLEALPDDALMGSLEAERGGGRDDYPIRVVWNSILAGVVFWHASIEVLRRDLSRSAQPRQLCGFDPLFTFGEIMDFAVRNLPRGRARDHEDRRGNCKRGSGRASDC